MTTHSSGVEQVCRAFSTGEGSLEIKRRYCLYFQQFSYPKAISRSPFCVLAKQYIVRCYLFSRFTKDIIYLNTPYDVHSSIYSFISFTWGAIAVVTSVTCMPPNSLEKLCKAGRRFLDTLLTSLELGRWEGRRVVIFRHLPPSQSCRYGPSQEELSGEKTWNDTNSNRNCFGRDALHLCRDLRTGCRDTVDKLSTKIQLPKVATCPSRFW